MLFIFKCFIFLCSYCFFPLFVCFSFCELVTFLAITTEFFTWKLIARFLVGHLMDVMNLCYMQYWLQGDTKENFDQHLFLFKAHYYSEKFLEFIKTSEASLLLHVSKICLTMFIIAFDMQSSVFKIIMQSNVAITMEAPFHVNPFIRFWCTSEASHIWQHVFSKFFKLAKIIVIQVLGSVEDERTFSTLSFMKSTLKNHLNEHLNIVVGMYS